MARGRLAKIGMLRRLIRVKSTLPRRPSPSLRRVSLRRVSPRRSPRRAAPPAAPLLSLPWRFYTSRSLAWRFCTLKARAACNNAAAMDPTCRNAAAMEPACRNAAPPSFRHSVSSRLGRLYVSKERQGPGRLGRRPSPTAAPAAHACFVALRTLICAACQRSDVSRPPAREGTILPRHPRTPNTRQSHAKHAASARKHAHKKGPAPRGCGPTKAGCESISRRWK